MTEDEKLWIKANYQYYVCDDPIMSDAEWDQLTIKLQKSKWSEEFLAKVLSIIPLNTLGHGMIE